MYSYLWCCIHWTCGRNCFLQRRRDLLRIWVRLLGSEADDGLRSAPVTTHHRGRQCNSHGAAPRPRLGSRQLPSLTRPPGPPLCQISARGHANLRSLASAAMGGAEAKTRWSPPFHSNSCGGKSAGIGGIRWLCACLCPRRRYFAWSVLLSLDWECFRCSFLLAQDVRCHGSWLGLLWP